MAQDQLRGVIRPMPEYLTHHRAGVMFPKEGREFVLGDAAMFEEAAKDARKYLDEAAKSGASIDSPDKPVIFEIVEENGFTKQPQKVQKRGRLIDLPGKPLLLDAFAYEYMRQAFGTMLVCEPLGGDPMATVSRLTMENEKMRARLAEFEKSAKK